MLSALRTAFPQPFKAAKSQSFSKTAERERCKKMQRSKQAGNVAFHKKLKEASPSPQPLPIQEQKHAAGAWSHRASHSTLLPTLLRPGHASLGVLLLPGHRKDRVSKRKQAGRKGKNKSIDTRGVNVLLGAFSLMAPHQQLHSQAFLLLHLCILNSSQDQQKELCSEPGPPLQAGTRTSGACAWQSATQPMHSNAC